MQLTVNTSFWHATAATPANAQLGDTLPKPSRASPSVGVRRFPDDGDLTPKFQAIANTAGFHFAWVEQGGTSLYAALAQRVTHEEVLRILLGVGGSEISFQTWQDKAGNAPALTQPRPGWCSRT